MLVTKKEAEQSRHMSLKLWRDCYQLRGRGFPIIAQEEKNTDLDFCLRLSLQGCTHTMNHQIKLKFLHHHRAKGPACPSMVSEGHPKCPKCQRTILVDMFCQRPANKSSVSLPFNLLLFLFLFSQEKLCMVLLFLQHFSSKFPISC